MLVEYGNSKLILTTNYHQTFGNIYIAINSIFYLKVVAVCLSLSILIVRITLMVSSNNFLFAIFAKPSRSLQTV